MLSGICEQCEWEIEEGSKAQYDKEKNQHKF